MQHGESRPLRVLHVVPSFHPAVYFGGPTVSLYSLCNHLASLPGIELRVMTTDTNGPKGTDRIRRDELRRSVFPGYEVTFYCKLLGADFSLSLCLDLWSRIAWCDVVHVTATYSSPTIPALLMARTLRKPVVWSPRGALQRWPGTTRRGAKLVWERVCDFLLHPERSALHVTSQSEADECRSRIRNARIVMIRNGIDVPESVRRRESQHDGQIRLLFLGRLDPKKGIENLLTALSRLPDEYVLRICGSGEPRYVRTLQTRSTQLRIAGRVDFSGPVHDEAKTSAFLAADICVVPSYTENFGMVVGESLAHGVPVIASTGTPWEEIERQNVGRWVSNDPASLASVIQLMRGNDLEEMGRRGRQWVAANFAWPSVAQQMLELYLNLSAKAPAHAV